MFLGHAKSFDTVVGCRLIVTSFLLGGGLLAIWRKGIKILLENRIRTF